MTPKELGRTIKKARRKHSIKQDELAEASNVEVRALLELEAGKPTAQVDTMLSVLSALGLRITLVEIDTERPLIRKSARRA
jgi:transcriptional regulator with XRE-family HTH domain